VAPGGSFASSRHWERCRTTPGAVFFGSKTAHGKIEDTLIGLLKKPWWVGPLIAGVSYNHYHADKPPEPAAVSGYEVVHNRGNLPRNGRVVVVATCPSGKRAISGGFSTPSPADTTDFSNPEGNNAWKVSFKSNGGSGNASVYAVCVTAN
jgi:hypothetical protein